jgi:hypothetical protein
MVGFIKRTAEGHSFQRYFPCNARTGNQKNRKITVDIRLLRLPYSAKD